MSELAYYIIKTDDSRLELDFVIQQDGQLLPIEVKAGGNVRANSLTKLLKDNPNMSALDAVIQRAGTINKYPIILCIVVPANRKRKLSA